MNKEIIYISSVRRLNSFKFHFKDHNIIHTKGQKTKKRQYVKIKKKLKKKQKEKISRIQLDRKKKRT